MLRKLFVISDDVNFTEQVKAMSVMLTKLNYFIDLKITSSKENIFPDKDVFYVIADVDSGEGLFRIKKIRMSKELKNIKIIAVYSEKLIKTRDEIFKEGCDAVMEKEEFLKVFDSIIK